MGQNNYSDKPQGVVVISPLPRLCDRLPYGNNNWVQRLTKKLDFDLVIHPRGRPKNAAGKAGESF